MLLALRIEISQKFNQNRSMYPILLETTRICTLCMYIHIELSKLLQQHYIGAKILKFYYPLGTDECAA